MIQEVTGDPPAEGGDWLFATVMGVVEGLTEFLPVSSTGHLIVTSAAFEKSNPTFEIGIQMGAITAILILYWGRVFSATLAIFGRGTAPVPGASGQRQINLIWLLIVAALPAAILGLLLEDVIDRYLFNTVTVAVMLIVGGALLLVLEAWQKRRGVTEAGALQIEQMTVRQALGIGVFQTLALIPGTSRAGAMIAGGMVFGFRRTASAEFSFLVGLPILYGAAILKLSAKPEVFTDPEFLVASVAAFVSAALVVKPFVRFLQNHTFAPFAWYRIVAGAVLLWLVHAGYIELQPIGK